ncbi:MAG: hypothetical protein HRT53_19110 [Colwellia sp.]|nr:hypothetical protein [Colwellia sp.]
MKFIENKTVNYQLYALIIFLVVSLLGCGGGGGSSEVPVIITEETTTDSGGEEDVDYSPDPDKLEITANASSELYAEATFSFDSFKSVTFDIRASDNLSKPLIGAMLLISVIDAEITAFDDPLLQNKSLLTKVFTDTNGQIYIRLEMAKSVGKILLELNTLGVKNDVILAVDDTKVITYSFAQNE